VIDPVYFIGQCNADEYDAGASDPVNEYQLAEIFVGCHDDPPVTGGHARDINIRHARRNRRGVQTVMAQVAHHRDHRPANVGVG
jgi:hypothetical protein